MIAAGEETHAEAISVPRSAESSVEEAASRQHACPVCEKVFKSASRLRVHSGTGNVFMKIILNQLVLANNRK
jgi:hypothetical protein